MTVSVLIPWSPGCEWRERSFRWVLAKYAAVHPTWEVVTGSSSSELFSRSQAILDAASRATGDVLVVADADVWCDPAAAVAAVAGPGWAIPHTLIRRLSPQSTEAVFAGAEHLTGLPLSTDNGQDSKPYKGHATGTLVVFTRDVLDQVPPDPRFVGWGREDDAWATALRTLVGSPVRYGADLVHLWHPPQERLSRTKASDENEALFRRYRAARARPARMAALIEEARCAL